MLTGGKPKKKNGERRLRSKPESRSSG